MRTHASSLDPDQKVAGARRRTEAEKMTFISRPSLRLVGWQQCAGSDAGRQFICYEVICYEVICYEVICYEAHLSRGAGAARQLVIYAPSVFAADGSGWQLGHQ
jgi:hypothetical protein